MSFLDRRIVFPFNQQIARKNLLLLSREEIPSLIDRFVDESKDKQIFVIQGGNRYISCYLQLHHKKQVASIKLLDISKVLLSVVLNTLLSSDERDLPLCKIQQNLIRDIFWDAPENRKQYVMKTLSFMGFTGLEEFLTKTNIAIALKTFGNFKLDSPFCYPADDRKIRKEFDSISLCAAETISKLQAADLLKIFCLNSSFYERINSSNGDVVYIDDVFYRGRTFYSILVLHLLLGLPSNFLLYTLCADRVSNNIQSEQIKILKPQVLYPFENCIRTEAGYWEECDDFFVFRDMYEYYSLLSHKVGHIPFRKEILIEWQSLLEQLYKHLQFRLLSKKTVLVLIELSLFHIAMKKELNIDALLDQRAKNIGFCTTFVKLIDAWIKQEEPRWKRQRYKMKIKAGIEEIMEMVRFENSVLVKKSLRYYQIWYEYLDYYFLKSFYSL